MKKEIV